LNLPDGFAMKFDNERLDPFEDIIELAVVEIAIAL